MIDPKWNNVNYYGKEEPLYGLKAAMMRVIMDAFWSPWTNETFLVENGLRMSFKRSSELIKSRYRGKK